MWFELCANGTLAIFIYVKVEWRTLFTFGCWIIAFAVMNTTTSEIENKGTTNIANNEELTVYDRNAMIELLYIDDLVDGMYDLLESKDSTVSTTVLIL